MTTGYRITFSTWNSEPYDDLDTWEQVVEAVRAEVEKDVLDNLDRFVSDPTDDYQVQRAVERQTTDAVGDMANGDQTWRFVDGSSMTLIEHVNGVDVGS